MTTDNLDRRLRKVEHRHGYWGDVRELTDAQLYGIVRSGYRQLHDEHGNLAQAAQHLRGTGNSDDAALAVLIEEDIGGPNAQRH